MRKDEPYSVEPMDIDKLLGKLEFTYSVSVCWWQWGLSVGIGVHEPPFKPRPWLGIDIGPVTIQVGWLG